MKVIPYNDNYSVDADGNIYSKTGRKLKCSINSLGYKQLFTYRDGKFDNAYLIHRLVYETFIDKIPDDKVIDHIDRDKTNNKLSNLRLVTFQQNLFNTDAKGYCWVKHAKKWRAKIQVNKKTIYLGYFNTELEARAAYLSAKEKLHIIHQNT
jgi:hypothetical protein